MKKILFQGDSITDCGRTSEEGESLGAGYPKMAADEFARLGSEVQVINRGVSGDRTIDLVRRWDPDCIQLAPDLVTILIGINDCWRKYDSNDETTPEEYESRYEFLIREIREKTRAEIILMEPFVLPEPADRRAWRVTLDPEIHAVRRLAAKYGTGFVPLDGLMNQAGIEQGYARIAADGVHPTEAGHQVITKAWMEEYFKVTGGKLEA